MTDVYALNQSPLALLRLNSCLEVVHASSGATKLDSRLTAKSDISALFPQFKSPDFTSWLVQRSGSIALDIELPGVGVYEAQIWSAEPLDVDSDVCVALTSKTQFAEQASSDFSAKTVVGNDLLALAAEQAWESICITDAEIESPGPHFVYVNRGFEELTGWSKSELTGKNPRIFQGPLTDRKVLDRLRHCLANSIPFHGEAINYRKNGEAFWLEWKISPVRDATGKTTNFIAFQRDITKVKASQQRIEDFHSVLSHELRAPLTSILGSLRLIEEFDLPQSSDGIEFLDIAISSTIRLSTLVNDLLELSKIESGQIELVLEDISAAELADTAANGLINYRADDKVSIEVDAIDATVRADRQRIIQVLINLISNAMKFSPANESVRVAVSRTDSGAIRFSVTDNGPGISAENQSKLFTKFQQLVSEDGVQRQGTGLGLSTVKALVEQHGGRLGVISSVGKGSTFWFELADAGAEALSSAAPPARALLLVEDDKSLARLIKFHLAAEGFVVHAVTTLSEANELIESTKLHACIVDMILPDGMGLTLAEKIEASSLNSKVPILMTSASRFSDSELGSPLAVSWLYKPFELGELTTQIKQMLNGNCQRLVVFENADTHWNSLPAIIGTDDFDTIDCAQDSCIDNFNAIKQSRNVVLKFDGSAKAEKNMAQLAKKMTSSQVIVICSKDKLSKKSKQSLNGLVTELISAETLNESEFVERLGTLLSSTAV